LNCFGLVQGKKVKHSWLRCIFFNEKKAQKNKFMAQSLFNLVLLHEDNLQKGIGSQLMQFAINEASTYKFKSLLAILPAANLVSLKLLEKFGFERWGLMPHVADIHGEICDHLYYGRKV